MLECQLKSSMFVNISWAYTVDVLILAKKQPGTDDANETIIVLCYKQANVHIKNKHTNPKQT